MLTGGLSRRAMEYTRAAARLSLPHVDVAPRRLRADGGSYPEKLEQLVPAYPEEVPLDPFTGEPLHCRDDDGGLNEDPCNSDVAHRPEGMGALEQ